MGMGRETPALDGGTQVGGAGAPVGGSGVWPVGAPVQQALVAPGAWCGAGAVAALEACVAAVDAARMAELALLDAVGRLHSEMHAFLTAQSDTEGGGSWRGSDLTAEVVDEFVLATGESRARTHQVLALVTAHPDLLACGRQAIVQGRAGLWRVLDWHAATGHLPVAVQVVIGEEVLTRLADGSPRPAASFRQKLAHRVRQADAADAAAARAKRDEAIRQRGSWANPSTTGDGTGCLSVTGEITRVSAAWARLDAAARRAKAAGDDRTLGQLRSDLHLDLLLVGQLPGTPPPEATGATTGEPAASGLASATGTQNTAGTRPHAGTFTPPASLEAASLMPPVCTACGAVSTDWFPIPTVGDPVLPPAKCTVVVGLDVLLENDPTKPDPGADLPAQDSPPGGSAPPGGFPPGNTAPPGRSTRPVQPGTPNHPHTIDTTITTTETVPYPGTPGNGDLGEAGLVESGEGVGLWWGAPLGRIPGFGYLDPEHVRAVATREGSIWQRLVADPVSGHAVSVSPYTYRPTASVARFVRARDGIARDPGSGTTAQECELDHVIPYEAGGTTTPDNLQCLSRRGHTRKTKRGWDARMNPDGTITWTTRLGQTTTTDPHDYTNP